MNAGENPLLAMLQHRIGDEGPMDVADFMALCLTHPQYGYYATRDPLGARGDFITAPEISQMFGELVGLWCVRAWQAMGEPRPFQLIELGPGRGTLMADLLRAASLTPAFMEAARLFLLESSPVLRRIQTRALGAFGPNLEHVDLFEAIPAAPCLIVANEFFDALPIQQYICTPAGWRRRLVGLNDAGQLAWTHAGGPASDEELRADFRPAKAQDGDIIEICPQGRKLARDMAQRFVARGGAALIIDYGTLTPGVGDTLQAVARHEPVDVFYRPGQVDLTAHVRFDILAAAARAGGAVVQTATTQRAFLRGLGIEQRLRRLSAGKAPALRLQLAADYRRLTGKNEMGELFKALVFCAPGLSLDGTSA